MRFGRIVLSIAMAMLVLSGLAHADELDKTLKTAKAEGKFVMIELGSVGCIPCEQMKPVMTRLSDTYKGKLEVIFIDVKKDRDTGRRYGVYMIPVQVFLDRSGKEVHRHVGFYPYEEITAMLKKTGI